MNSRPTIIIATDSVAAFPEGGGHFWVYLQYVLALRQLGCDVYWLEAFRTKGRQEQEAAALATFRARLDQHGLAGNLYRFETCRRSDPGLDLGRFAADLLRFALSQHDATAYRLCRDAFLESYNGEAERPVDGDDLQFYLAIALSERVARSDICTEADALELLCALDPVELFSPTPPGK